MVEVFYSRLGFHVFYLLCTVLSTSATVGKGCHLQNRFDSPFVRASYRDRISPSAMCHTNSMGSLQQIHVINYVSTDFNTSHAGVHLMINPKGERIRSQTLLFILNSDLSVQWEVELTSAESFDVSLFRFVIDQSSTLDFASQSQEYEVLTNDSLPIDDRELLSWVRRTFGNVTSFADINDADEIIIYANAEESYPNECDLNSATSSVVAYRTEDRPILGCAPNLHEGERQVHVIELFSPKNNIDDDSRGRVRVHIQSDGTDDRQEGMRNALLILISLSPTLWEVSSDRFPGTLDIVSNTHVDISNANFYHYSMFVRSDVVAIKKGLLRWVQEEYGQIASYSNVRVANQFDIYLAAPMPSEPQQPTTPVPATANTGPNPTRFDRTDLALNSTVSCSDSGIQVVVPIRLVNRYGLTPGMLSWIDRSCTADMTEEGLVLKAGLQECGSEIVAISETTVEVSNQAIFYSSDVREGSGSTTAWDDEDAGDEDEESDRKYVRCEYTFNDERLGTSEPRTINDRVSVALDLYTDESFRMRRRTEPYRVEPGLPVYLQMSVREDPTLDVVMDECWIGTGQNKKYHQALHRVTENGCPVDPSFHYLPLNNEQYPGQTSPGTIKRFTFLVPDVNLSIMTFFLYCNLSICNSGPMEHPRIVECSSLPDENVPCSEWKNHHLWPVKNLQIGPFRITSREMIPPYNMSKKLPDNYCATGPNMSKHVLALVIVFSFLLGVLLVSTIWVITKYTRVPSEASTGTPPANSPMDNNGIVPNGHLPNGHLPNGPERMPFLPPSNSVNPNNIPLHGMYNGVEDQQV